MAYNKADLERQALEAIKENNLMFVTDVPTYLPCSVATFYNKKLEELESIKDALERNRSKTKNGLRAKWYKNDNATTQIALYKLLANEDELRKLNSQYMDHTTGGEKINLVRVEIINSSAPITSEDDISEDI